MYRLANSAKVSADLANTAYAAFELLGSVNGAMLSSDDARKLAKTRDDLMTYAAGAYVPKVPAEVLETLSWVQQMAQERATDSDFNTAAEALEEHDALRFVTNWLEASGVDVTKIRGAELDPEARAEYEAEHAAEVEAGRLALESTLKAAAEPGDVIREALAPFLGSTVAENHADDVLDSLERAGFIITRAPKA